jgi:hypothetical protein
MDVGKQSSGTFQAATERVVPLRCLSGTLRRIEAEGDEEETQNTNAMSFYYNRSEESELPKSTDAVRRTSRPST